MNTFIREVRHHELLETARIYIECHQRDFPFLPDAWRVKDEQAEVRECYAWLANDPLAKVYAAFDHAAPGGAAAAGGAAMTGYIAVGRNIGEPRQYEGEVTGFFVRGAYRKRGVGLRLLWTAVTYVQGLSWARVLVYTLSRGESAGYYRRLGGELVRQVTQTFAGQPETVEVYGWQVATLLATLGERLKSHQLSGMPG